MLGKQVLVDRCRDLAVSHLDGHYDDATILLHRVAAYECTYNLGGPACASLVKALGDLRLAPGGSSSTRSRGLSFRRENMSATPVAE